MQYRVLGKTGLKVSTLGFGAMRLPMIGDGENQRVDREKAIPMIHRAFEAGVNYIDTAVGYCNKDSQRVVGEALQGWRDRIIVSTKNPYYDNDEKTWWKNLEDSLERLGVEYIDIYNHHGLNWKRYTEAVEPRIGKWMRSARDQGLIKHICCSFHDSNEALKKIIDTGYPESITLQYNLLNRDLEEGIAYASENGLGVVVMGPVAGGRLGATSEVLEEMVEGIARVPELALRFVLGNPNVSVALSGMSTLQQVEENIETASLDTPLTREETGVLDEHTKRLRALADLYCTGCNYCMPCPQKVAIAWIFNQYNWGRVYGLWDIAKEKYNSLGTGGWTEHLNAEACIECGECEEKCPQHIPIRKQLKEAHEALSKNK